jgi:hypothetical protein
VIDPVGPSEYSARPLARTTSPRPACFPGVDQSFRVFNTRRLSLHRFRKAASSLAFSSTLRLSAADAGREVLTTPRILSSTLILLQSHTRSHLAAYAVETTPTAPLLGFASLQHLPASRVHCSRVCLARYVPPSGFGYPLGGLLPAALGRACFVPTAFVGFSLRSLLLPKGGSPRFRGTEPACR